MKRWWQNFGSALGLLVVVGISSWWFSREDESSAPSVETTAPVNSELPEVTHELTVEVFTHGVPIARAGVLVEHTEPPRISSSQHCDARGSVTFSNLPPGGYRITAAHSGYLKKTRTIQLEHPRQVLRLALQSSDDVPTSSASIPPYPSPSGSLRGRAVNSAR